MKIDNAVAIILFAFFFGLGLYFGSANGYYWGQEQGKLHEIRVCEDFLNDTFPPDGKLNRAINLKFKEYQDRPRLEDKLEYK